MRIFREEKYVGRLIHVEPSATNQYTAHIWFDYSLKLMQSLKEGDFVAIESFASQPEKRRHYVILEIVKKLPIHFALVQNVESARRTYPGFLMESAKSASLDWISQIEESTEDTTKIVCEAIPINLGFWITEEGIEGPEQSFELPMTGKEVKIVSYEFMEGIINKGLKERETAVDIGYLKDNRKIKVLIDSEALLRLHFGIFGFTGAGKSNLLSTLISKVMKKSPQGTKVVVFDIMGEYLTLLMDLLINYKDSLVLGVGVETFVEALYEYYRSGNSDDRRRAVKVLTESNLYPKRLLPYKRHFTKPFTGLVKRRAFKVYEEVVVNLDKTIGEVVKEVGGPKADKDNLPKLQQVVKKYQDKKVREKGREFLEELKSFNFSPKADGGKFVKAVEEKIGFKDSIFPLLNVDGVFISLEEIVELLNDPRKKSLFIVQSHDPSALKRFVNSLATAIYEDRRKKGKIEPLVLFVLDEADEYIPQEAKDEAKLSRDAVEMLARRGRKFGLGVGIATQRVVYLDTNIMAQPHTYFVSKLPRSSDRERVAQAFAIDEGMFEQTFRFGKGDWLLMSHDATGLESIPFPIHTENAEERIIKFLENLGK